MQLATFRSGLQRIQAITKRELSAKPADPDQPDLNERDIFWSALRWLTDGNFNKIAEEYISELNPPRNLMAYFLARAKDIQPSSSITKTPVLNLPYSQQERELLESLVVKSRQLAKREMLPNQDAWLSRVYRLWDRLPQDELTTFLSKKLADLELLESKFQPVGA